MRKSIVIQLLIPLCLILSGVTTSFASASADPANTGKVPQIELEFMVGSKTFTQNDIKKTMSVSPFYREARMFVPARYIIESLGGTIYWNQDTKETSVTVGGTNIIMTDGSTTATVNGERKPIDISNPKITPTIENRRFFIPLRFISEEINAAVIWNPYNRTATIRSPKPTLEKFENSSFSVKYPENWTKEVDNLDVMLVSPENCLITVNTEELPTDVKTLDQYYSHNVKQMNEEFKNPAIITRTEAVISGLAGRRISYTATVDNTPLKFTQAFLIKNNKGYTITYMAAAGLFFNYTEVMEEAFSSLIIK